MGNLNSNYMAWYSILKFLQNDGTLVVPSNYHKRCAAVQSMLQSDTSGMINVLTDFAVNTGSEVTYKIETKNNSLQDLLNSWINTINFNYMGKIPIGINELSKEYMKERWKGSSLCIMKVNFVKSKGFFLPDAIWFLDGSNIYVKKATSSRTIGGYEYYYDKDFKHKVTGDFIVRKPFSRWHEQYPTPYLIRQGVYRNFYGLNILKEQGEKVLNKLLPYLIMLKKGNNDLVKQGISYDDNDMKQLESNFKAFLNNYENKTKQAPMYTTPFDVDLTHIIPDMKNILNKDLYAEADKSILSGLGFVEVADSVTSSRKESVMNPKPFISEVNAGVEGFKSMLNDVVRLIIMKNKIGHKKYFNDINSIRIVSSPLRLDADAILDYLRSGYDRGFVSIATIQHALRLDPIVEAERREKEDKEGLTDLMKPHMVTYQPETSSSDVDTQEKNEKEGKSGTEKIDYVSAEAVFPPYKSIQELDEREPDAKDYTKEEKELYIKVYNEVYARTSDVEKAKVSAARSVDSFEVGSVVPDGTWIPDPVKKHLPEKYHTLWLSIYWEVYQVTYTEDIAKNVAWKVVEKVYKEETGEDLSYIWD